MTATDDILASLPIDQLADQLGADPADVRRAVTATVPALLGGLDANAQDGGADSLLRALGQHDDHMLAGGVDLDDIDTSDGSAIAGHIFGGHEDAVVSQLGELPAAGSGGSLGGDLIRRLIPILAPIVLSYLAGKVFGGNQRSGGTSGGGAAPQDQSGSLPMPSGSGTTAARGPGSLQDMLNDVLGSAVGGAAGSGTSSSGSSNGTATAPAGGIDAGRIITDLLGGLLGGGRR